MRNVIYIKTVDDYCEIFKKNNIKISLFFKKVVYLYKNIFNIITKKKIEDLNIWILPICEKCSQSKIDNIVKKLAKTNENIYVFPNDLLNKHICKQIDKYKLNYLNGKKIKKYLLIKILSYINNIQGINLENLDITFVIDTATKFDMYLIEQLAQITKSIKIVSKNFSQFKKFFLISIGCNIKWK